MDIGGIMLSMVGGDLVLLGFLGGIIAAVLNLIGATPILFFKQVPKLLLDVGLGFAAGVMLAASFTSLIIPGIEHGGVLPVVAGLALGSLFTSLIDQLLPHMHFEKGREGPTVSRLKAVWLFVIAITIHNLPEGLAVGVGLGSGDIVAGVSLMLAIGLQNIPEGLSVGFSLLSSREYGHMRAYLVSVASGFVEPPLAFLGAWAVSAIHQILPYAMGFAAGAMIFVISDEIIPETHRLGKERKATYGLVAGLLIMLTLDTVLG